MAANEGSWDEPDDARIKAGKYPNYYSHKTPSGHTFIMDDSKGAEHVTLQHRSGSMIQMHPDGSVVVRSHGTKYEVVFGDGKMLVTGSMDVTVNGGGSLRVEGDYDLTVAGNMNTVVSGNMETVVHGNQNTMVNGNQETAIKGSQSTKVSTNTEHTTEGKAYIAGHDAMYVESTGGPLTLNASGETRINAGDDMWVTGGANMQTFFEDVITIDGSLIQMNPS